MLMIDPGGMLLFSCSQDYSFLMFVFVINSSFHKAFE